MRHWLSRIEGSAEGIALATAMARAWQELGLGGDGAGWLQLQVARPRTTTPRRPPPASRPRRSGAGSTSRRKTPTGRDLLVTVAAAEDWESWLHGSVFAVLAMDGAGGDLQEGAELLIGQVAQDALAQVGDPWFGLQRQAVLALGPLGAGNFAPGARLPRADRRPVPRARRHVDGVAAPRPQRDVRPDHRRWDEVDRELERAAPLEALGLARGAAVLLDVERAVRPAGPRRRAGGDAGMHSAIDALERAGGLRQVALAPSRPRGVARGGRPVGRGGGPGPHRDRRRSCATTTSGRRWGWRCWSASPRARTPPASRVRRSG